MNTSSAAAAAQLPLFSIPDARRNCQLSMAALFRDICYNHARPEGCIAGNAFLSSQCGVVPGHVPALLNRLKDCGLIDVQIERGNKRRIRPLVSLPVVMRAGWKALWYAVLARDLTPAPFRRLAQWLMEREPSGKPDLAKMGVEDARIPSSRSWRTATTVRTVASNSEGLSFNSEGLERFTEGREAGLSQRSEGQGSSPEAPKSAQKSEGSLKLTLKGFPYKEHRREASTSTVPGVRAEPEPAPAADPAAVLLLTQIGLQSAEARALAVGVKKDGGTLEQLQHAVSVALTSAPQNFGGFVRSAIRAAVSGAAYLKPIPKEERERPQRVVVAPVTLRTASRVEREQKEAQKRVNATWEALPSMEKDYWLSGALYEVLGEVSGPAHKGVTKRGKEHPIVIARAKRLAGKLTTEPYCDRVTQA